MPFRCATSFSGLVLNLVVPDLQVREPGQLADRLDNGGMANQFFVCLRCFPDVDDLPDWLCAFRLVLAVGGVVQVAEENGLRIVLPESVRSDFEDAVEFGADRVDLPVGQDLSGV